MIISQIDPGIIDLIIQGGGLAVAAIVLFLLVKPSPGLVPGWLYKREIERADKWEKLALRGTDLAESGSELAHTIAEAVHEVYKREKSNKEEKIK